jgi:MFS family permease
MSRPRTFPIVLAGFTAFLDLYATQPLLPLLMRVFNATHVAVSLTVTASTVAVALGAPVVGRLADLVGRKRVIVGSSLALALATGLAATSTNLRQLIFWRFAQGLFTPGVFAIAIAYIHDEWPPSHAGRATSAYVSGTVVGGFCGRAVAGLVASAAGWPSAFVVLATLNLGAAAALALWLPRDRTAPPSAVGHGRSVLALFRNRCSSRRTG